MMGMILGVVGMVEARPVEGEVSKYGAFVLRKKGEVCELVLTSTGRGEVMLWSMEECSYVEAMEMLGTMLFPVLGPDGTEFHVFS